MAMQKLQVGVVFAVAMTAIVVSALAAGLLSAYQAVPNTGHVKAAGVGVYWNSACTSNVTFIDWGLLEPGAASNVSVYIQNKGNVPVRLNLSTSNWNPAGAADYIKLSWNREGYVLTPTNPIVQAVLTLSVSGNITEVTNFGFDIVITGIEYTSA